MKKSLGDYRDEYFAASATVSEINRSLGLAAVAIIWTFTKVSDKNEIQLSGWLEYALLFVIIALIIDLLQYIWRTATIAAFYRIREKAYDKLPPAERAEKSEDVNDFPSILKRITWGFFILKILFMIIGYINILCFIQSKIRA